MAGMAWITVANSLTVAAQMALPDWVRARGMSIYQMSLMGGAAVGAAVWGQVASLSSVPIALGSAAVRLDEAEDGDRFAVDLYDAARGPQLGRSGVRMTDAREGRRDGCGRTSGEEATTR